MNVLDIEQHDQLINYLSESGRIDVSDITRCETLLGGVSCRTVLVVRQRGDDLVLKQALEFLRVAEIWQGDPTRIEREAEAMRALNELLDQSQVPQLMFEDRSEHVIGMTAVAQPHENWKSVLLRGEVTDRDVTEFAQILGKIHRGAYLQRDVMAQRFADRSQFETLRVDPYYRHTAKGQPALAPWFNSLISETADAQITLVHGDFSPKNVLLGPEGCVLLDHEVAHWGDPAFDIGFATAHFLGKANHMANHRHRFGDAALLFWQTYRDINQDLPWFPAMADRAVLHSLACVLARVCGKSPLEYLTDDQRDRQRLAALALISSDSQTYDELVSRYLQRISQ